MSLGSDWWRRRRQKRARIVIPTMVRSLIKAAERSAIESAMRELMRLAKFER